MDEDARPWVDAFYVTTYRDPQALHEPKLKARGQYRHGPFTTYGDAELYGQQINCTHYSIDKVKVAPNIHPPFLDHTGNRIEIPLMELDLDN